MNDFYPFPNWDDHQANYWNTFEDIAIHYVNAHKWAVHYLRVLNDVSIYQRLLNDKAHDLACKALDVAIHKKLSGSYQEKGALERFIRVIVHKLVLWNLDTNKRMASSDLLDANMPDNDLDEDTLNLIALECCKQQLIENGKKRHFQLYFEKVSYNVSREELAEDHQLTLNGVKKRLDTIRPLLKKCLEEKRKGLIMANLFIYADWETQIKAYLHNDLSTEARQAFETAMAQNPDLKDAVDFDITFTKYAHQQHLFNTFKPQMDTYLAEHFPEETLHQQDSKVEIAPARTASSPFWKLGLASLAMVGLGWGVYTSLQDRQHHAFVQQWLEPLQYGYTQMDETKDSLALKAYQAGRFTDAEAIFVTNDAQLPARGEGAELYRAVNAVLAWQPDRAIPILTAHLKETEIVFQRDAVHWYLAMAYLQKKEYSNAKRILQTIDNQKYATKVEQLLRSLK